MTTTYLPRLKPRGFTPNPIALYGIPDYANTISHPEVEGTTAWRQWWEEQIYYYLNGYNTAGVDIPGRLYYYLNCGVISGVGRGSMYPEYYDLVHDIADLVEEAKKNNEGIIGLKSRRKGWSYYISIAVTDYGMRFIDSYQAGVCAGQSEHISDYYNKLINQWYLRPPELKMHLLTKGSVDNETPMIGGYRVKTAQGWEEKGTKNIVHWATMYRNPNKFKGKYLHDQIFEEIGEFPLAEKCYNASQDCWMEGDIMIGTPILFGTAGDITSSSADFKKMYSKPEAFKLRKIFVPATRMYFPCVSGYKDRAGVLKEDVPYLKTKYQPWERYGMEDVERASERIDMRIAELKKLDDKSQLYDFMQNNPRSEKEAWLQFSANNFNMLAINDQMWKIENNRRRYGIYRLDWVKDKNGKLVTPMKVRCEADSRNGNWLILEHPRPNYLNLDVGGIDSYDQDISLSSKSLGAMVVYRRKHTMRELTSEAPVALLYYRPRRQETFYEEALKGAVYYNLIGNVLFDVANSRIVEFWNQYVGRRFWAPRPKKFDAPHSTQVHDIGVRLTGYSKPIMLSLLQSYFFEHTHKCWFPAILQDALDYDEKARHSDWDSVDALGIALMRDSDMSSNIIDQNEIVKEAPDALPEWTEDIDGNTVEKIGTKEVSEDVTDPFLRLVYSGQLGT